MFKELMVYGHGIEGLAFFHMEIPNVPPPVPSLSAIVTVLGNSVASPEMIEAELSHLSHCQWDWQVTVTAGHQISVIIPDIASHDLCTQSDEITLALNKLVVDISELKLDPKAVPVLDMAWILTVGLPDIPRSEGVIYNMARILGKVVVVDELSLRKAEEVCVKTKCLDSSKLRVTVRVLLNNIGYALKIRPEPLNHIGRPRFQDDGNNRWGRRCWWGYGVTTPVASDIPAPMMRRSSSTTVDHLLRTPPSRQVGGSTTSAIRCDGINLVQEIANTI
ncbi:hypothetical protein ZWY2020_042256 [Hordeum vulgare]|nr:hypothetical protein ZWY2020_042256 [Hordeum vulgare]